MLPPEFAGDSHDGRIKGATRGTRARPGVVRRYWLTSRPEAAVSGGVNRAAVDDDIHDSIRRDRRAMNGASA
jgi:hypothetical protein